MFPKEKKEIYILVGVGSGVWLGVGEINGVVGVGVGEIVGMVEVGVVVGWSIVFCVLDADFFCENVWGKTLEPVVGCPLTINLDPFAILPDLGLMFNPITILLNLRITNHNFHNLVLTVDYHIFSEMDLKVLIGC